MPIAIPKPLIAQKAPYFVPDTLLSYPESSLPFPEPQPALQIIPEPSLKCSAVIAIEGLCPITPVITSQFENSISEPSYSPAISMLPLPIPLKLFPPYVNHFVSHQPYLRF
jgi:hypothetical protein